MKGGSNGSASRRRGPSSSNVGGQEEEQRRRRQNARKGLGRRQMLGGGVGLVGISGQRESAAEAAPVAVGGQARRAQQVAGQAAKDVAALECVPTVLNSDFLDVGPYKVSNLKVEHTCSICFPRCLGDQCIIRVHLYYPTSVLWTYSTTARTTSSGSSGAGGVCIDSKAVAAASPRNTGKPWPLAIFSSGFLVSSDQYRSYAEHLASYGYVAVLYDKVENLSSTIDDETSSLFVSEIINWLESPAFQGGLQTEAVYAVGHSRGGKISLLAAENDKRIGAVCLVDPVDSNEYAPEGPGYPSAIKSLPTFSTPLAIIGGGHSEDCIPVQSNYKRFFENASSRALLCNVKEAGHFQYLDKTSPIQAAVCSEGKVASQAVRDLSKAVIVAWAEIMLPQRGAKTNLKSQLTVLNIAVEKWLKTNVFQNADVNFEVKGF